jgi:ParB family transcriptional regulator, chromosome partitioning protein
MEEVFQYPNDPEIPPMEPAKPTLMHLPIEKVEPDAQIRLDFDEEAIDGLAKSLRSEGQIVAILAYHDEARDKYVILDGERRYRAARKAGLAELRAEVFPYRPSSEEVLLMQLSIDQMRENLNPVEQAAAYRKIMDTNGWNASDLAAHIHVSHTTITRAASLLELPPELQALVRTKVLSAAIAREIARVTDPALRNSVWEKVKKDDLNATQTQQLVTKLLRAPKGKTRGPKPKPKFSYRNLQGGFDALITTKTITLKATKKGRTNDDIERALEMLLQRFREDRAKTEAQGQGRPQEAPVAEAALAS